VPETPPVAVVPPVDFVPPCHPSDSAAVHLSPLQRCCPCENSAIRRALLDHHTSECGEEKNAEDATCAVPESNESMAASGSSVHVIST